MQQSVAVIGQGEMGGVFSRAFLRAGYAVTPVTRDQDITNIQQQWPQVALVVVAVSEKALAEVLPRLSPAWRDGAVLIQNELLPQDWLSYGEDYQPTVISVWFEKKPGQDVKVIIPSPVYGKHSQALAAALETLQIPCTILATPEQLLYQLVLKNLYILTSNIAGLKYGGNVGDLWLQQPAFTRRLAKEVIEIQSRLTGASFDKNRLIEDMLVAFDGDPAHKCMGRSAPARLQSALQHGKRFSLELPTLQEIATANN